MNVCYMLRCADGSLYTGWTNNLENRLRAHNEGRGGKYTRSHRPVTLAWFETFETREEAMRREWQVKRLDKKEKEALAASFSQKLLTVGAENGSIRSGVEDLNPPPYTGGERHD